MTRDANKGRQTIAVFRRKKIVDFLKFNDIHRFEKAEFLQTLILDVFRKKNVFLAGGVYSYNLYRIGIFDEATFESDTRIFDAKVSPNGINIVAGSVNKILIYEVKK